MFQVHKFDSTAEAYDATQCDNNVAKGDILIIESEGVVGIANTWPIAVTTNRGELHYVKDTSLFNEFIHSELAFEIAKAYGWDSVKV